MAVAEKYRRNGVAEALMKEMEERGRQKDVTIFFLEVRESNDAARRLYEKWDMNKSVSVKIFTRSRRKMP